MHRQPIRTAVAKADIDASTVDLKLKNAVDGCLAFLNTTQWVGREYRRPCNLTELERGLHRTLARDLGHDLVHRLTQLRKLGADFDRQHQPFQRPDHERNQFALSALCEELSSTGEVLEEARTLVKRMIDHKLYPELNLEPHLKYLDKLYLVLRSNCHTLNCCREFYEEPPEDTYHPENLRLRLANPLRGRLFSGKEQRMAQ